FFRLPHPRPLSTNWRGEQNSSHQLWKVPSPCMERGFRGEVSLFRRSERLSPASIAHRFHLQTCAAPSNHVDSKPVSAAFMCIDRKVALLRKADLKQIKQMRNFSSVMHLFFT